MKNLLYLFLSALLLVACKNSETTNNEETSELSEEEIVELPIYRGEFIYTAEASVLKVGEVVYAVKMDSMAQVLADKVAPVKKDDFDMVPVVIQGTVEPNPVLSEGKEGWKEMIAVKRIITISQSPAEPDVKIEEKN